MASRPHNFNAGPAILPLSVMEEVRDQLLDTADSGLSILEWSHRSPDYETVRQEAADRFFRLIGEPRDGRFELFFLQGGASTQFSSVPMNLATPDKPGGYLVTGVWAKKAAAEAARFGLGKVLWDGKEENYGRLPRADEFSAGSDLSYLHVTTNNTIFGTEFLSFPKSEAPLVLDMSSDILSRPHDLSNVGLIYAGAQKNLGPAGVTLVLVRKDLLEAEPSLTVPAMLDYRVHQKGEGIYNTPPTFGVWLMGKTFAWIESEGGLAGMQARNEAKGKVLYDAIDGSEGFYRGTAAMNARSLMNITFRLPSEELEKTFLTEAKAAGFVGLKGHRSVGGCRASTYNALPQSSVEALVEFMGAFAARNG